MFMFQQPIILQSFNQVRNIASLIYLCDGNCDRRKTKKKIRLCPRLSFFLFSNYACVWISLFILTQTQWLRCRPKIKPQISRYVVVSSQTWLNWSADEIKTDSSKHVPVLCFYSMTEIETVMPKRKPNPIIIHKKETKHFRKWAIFTDYPPNDIF